MKVFNLGNGLNYVQSGVISNTIWTQITAFLSAKPDNVWESWKKTAWTLCYMRQSNFSPFTYLLTMLIF